MKRVSIAVAVATALLPLSQPAFAQGSCEASVLSRMQRDTEQFGEDVKDASVSFAKEEMGEAALAAGRDLLKDNVTSEAIFDTRDKWTKWKEHVEAGRKALADVGECAPNYANSCLLDVAKRQSDEIRKWLTSLAGDGVQAVTERVAKAGGLYRSYAERAFGTAQNSMQSYLNNCATVAEQRVQSRNTINSNSNPAAPKSGIGAGKIAALAVAAAGTVGVGVGGYRYYRSVMEENEAFLSEFGNISTPTSSPVPNTTPTTPAPPTGVRAFDGTYDFRITVTGPGGTESVIPLSQFLIINNGSVTTTARDLTGTVSGTGRLTGVGACPINNNPADYEGTMLTNGTGSGTYRCRTGGISRGWQALGRR